MIKVEKELRIVIDGEDAHTLRDVCELARRLVRHGGTQAEYREEGMWKIKNFLNYIFDNT